MKADELVSNVVFAALIPAARLAATSRVPLRELKRLSELATYRELRNRRLTMKEITERISVSMAKVGLLSRQLKDHFSRADREYGVARRILTILWDGPKTEAQILQTLDGAETDDVRDALSELLSDGLILTDDSRTTRYRLSESKYRLFKQPWMAKLDALNHLMSSVSDVIQARFFAGDERAFSRTLSFRVRENDLPQLRALYEEHIFPAVVALDARATEGDGDPTVPLTLSILWSPERGAEDDPDQEG